jgi:hypothetical protein
METLGAVIDLVDANDGGALDDGAPEIVVEAEKVTVADPKAGDPDKDKDAGSQTKTKRRGDWWFGNR